jgi:single-strand DNA-binding protein
MASLNKCIFIGNSGAAPEVRQFDNGNKVANVRIAVTERYTDRNNQPVENTEWIPLVFNGKLADIAAQYIQKGTSIYVEGKWKTRKWTDQSGVEHYSTEVRVDNMQLLSPRPQAQQPAQPQAPAAPPQYQQAPPRYNQPAPPPQPQYQQAPPAPQYAAPPQPQYQQAPAPQSTVDDLPPAGGFDPDLGF